jgi:hypothetical protein
MLDIQAKCNNANIAIKFFPPILLHHLIHLHGCEFATIVIKYYPKLLMFWDVQLITDIETFHMNLCNAYNKELALKNHLMNVIIAHLSRKVRHLCLGSSTSS